MSTGRSFADIYKCVSDDGVATFSDTPCSNKPELFLNIKNLSIDDAIDLANPLTEFDVDSKTIDEDLLSHAKKLGKSILPDEQYTSYIMDGGGRGSVYRYPEWNISVLYG
ncbi:MAG: DUF4124 domain-containing protein, partial [Proteobacteria bacterium]|nr:DUF4124 domain-containing protein [Pseudomonadota bacterium]